MNSEAEASDRDERLNAYLDGELGEVERVRFEAELERDLKLREELAALTRLDRELRHAQGVRAETAANTDSAVHASDEALVMAALAATESRETASWPVSQGAPLPARRFPFRVAGLAASVLCVMLGFWLGYRSGSSEAPPYFQGALVESGEWRLVASSSDDQGIRLEELVVSGRYAADGRRVELQHPSLGLLRLNHDAVVDLGDSLGLDSGSVWVRTGSKSLSVSIPLARLLVGPATELSLHVSDSILSLAVLSGSLEVVPESGEISTFRALQAGSGPIHHPIAAYDVVFPEKHRAWTWPLVVGRPGLETEVRERVGGLLAYLGDSELSRMAKTMLRESIGSRVIPDVVSYLERPAFAVSPTAREEAIDLLHDFAARSRKANEASPFSDENVERLFDLAVEFGQDGALPMVEVMYQVCRMDFPVGIKKALSPDATESDYLAQMELWREAWRATRSDRDP